MWSTRIPVSLLLSAALIASISRAAQAGNNDPLAGHGKGGGTGAPSKQSKMVQRPNAKTPLPLLLGLDVRRAGTTPMQGASRALLKSLEKDLFLAGMKRTCGFDLVRHVTRIEIATTDLRLKSAPNAVLIRGSFHAARVLACFKKLFARQRPRVTGLGGRQVLMFTSPSGKAQAVVVTGPHEFVLAQPASLSWVLSGNLWSHSVTLGTLRSLVPRRALVWLALGEVPLSAPMLQSMFPGVRTIEALLMTLVPARRARGASRWRLGGRFRLATESVAVQFLQGLRRGLAMFAMAFKSSAPHPPKGAGALRRLLQSVKLSRSGRDVLFNAPLGDADAQILINAVRSGVSNHP